MTCVEPAHVHLGLSHTSIHSFCAGVLTEPLSVAASRTYLRRMALLAGSRARRQEARRAQLAVGRHRDRLQFLQQFLGHPKQAQLDLRAVVGQVVSPAAANTRCSSGGVGGGGEEEKSAPPLAHGHSLSRRSAGIACR